MNPFKSLQNKRFGTVFSTFGNALMSYYQRVMGKENVGGEYISGLYGVFKKTLSITLVAMFLIFGLTSSKKRFKANPPGTIRLTDSLYIDAFPVRVRDYVEFLRSVKSFYNTALHDSIAKMPMFGLGSDDLAGLRRTFHGDSLEYLQMLTRTWVTYANDERHYDVDFRLKSAKYYDFPVVNITYRQMRHYCVWRTDMVKLHYAFICKTEKQRLKYPLNFVYRMVKRKEWEAALGEYFYDVKKSKDMRNNGPKNVVKAYKKERGRKFYYDVDNAAETLDKAIVTFNFKWMDKAGIGDISYFKFTEPKDWITFRCICEVLPPEGPK